MIQNKQYDMMWCLSNSKEEYGHLLVMYEDQVININELALQNLFLKKQTCRCREHQEHTYIPDECFGIKTIQNQCFTPHPTSIQGTDGTIHVINKPLPWHLFNTTPISKNISLKNVTCVARVPAVVCYRQNRLIALLFSWNCIFSDRFVSANPRFGHWDT